MRVLVSILLASVCVSQSHAAEWSYTDDSGPDKWASIAPENDLCATGKNQSPVDIDTKKTANSETRGIKFDYDMTLPESITNTGNLIQVNTRGWAKLNADDIEFELKRIEFHIPSEHTVNGEHFPMELEFVHESKDNQVAIFSRMAAPGRPDRTLRKLLENLPMEAGKTENLPGNALKTIQIVKTYGNYFRYNGSSTRPPCNEGVRWYLMKEPMSFSKEQYDLLKSAIKQDNNRPVQALNARVIME